MAIYTFEQAVKKTGATPDKINSLSNPVDTTEAGTSNLFTETIKGLPKAATQILVDPAVKFGVSALASPIDMGRGVLGKAPLSGEFPLPSGDMSKTIQSEFTDKAKQVTEGSLSPLEATASTVLDTVTGAGDVLGAEQLVKGGVQFAKTGVNLAKESLSNKGLKIAEKFIPKSEEIMNRVARLNPSDARRFTELSDGKTVGQYLTETGNFNRPDKIVTNEAEKFISSIKSVDESFAKLPGRFEDGSIKDALNNLVSRAESVSSDNVKAPYLDRAKELLTKYNSGGLDMSEINEVKRLFEKNVKLGYSKLINPDAVQKATYIDDTLRNWQAKKAESLGFKNISELNKQTQLSKFIIDNLGDKIIDKSLLNGVSLSDWIMLSSGDVTGVSGFLTKKFFSDPGIQARIAKLLNSKEIKGLITPEMGVSEVLGLPAPAEGAIKSSVNLPINQPSRKVIDSGTEIVPKPSMSK